MNKAPSQAQAKTHAAWPNGWRTTPHPTLHRLRSIGDGMKTFLKWIVVFAAVEIIVRVIDRLRRR